MEHQSVVLHDIPVVVDQQHMLEFYLRRNFTLVDVVQGTIILVHIDLLLTLMVHFDSNSLKSTTCVTFVFLQIKQILSIAHV